MKREVASTGKKVWSNICTKVSLEEKSKVLSKAAADGMNPSELLKYLLRDYLGDESSIQNKKRIETIVEVEKFIKIPEYLSDDVKGIMRKILNALRNAETQRDNYHKSLMMLKSRHGDLFDYERLSLMNNNYFDEKESNHLSTDVERIIARYEDKGE